MDYIKEKTPPVREDRLGACSAFGGSCCELGRQSGEGCLNQAARSFSQTQGCQLSLSLAILNTIRNAVIIVHGPIGCGASNAALTGVTKTFQRLRDGKAGGLIWLNTNLNEADVISGGEAKLKDAVLFAESEFRPEALIIVNSCVPALIGDDLDGIVARLQEEVSAKIVPIHCEGFKTKIMASAYDAVYHGILRNLMEKEEDPRTVIPDDLETLKEQYRINRTVNILNVSSMSRADEKELTRLVEALDLHVRILPCFARPDDFASVSEAALNVSICSTHDDYFAGHIEERYGIPFLIHSIPVGVRNVSEWLCAIARFFGKEKQAEQLIERETNDLESAVAPYREVLKGKRAFITGGEIRVLAMAELLQDLGMKIIGLKGYHFDRFGEEALHEFAENEEVPFTIGAGQPFEQANLLERLKPDIFVGHVGGNASAAKQGIPVFPLFGPGAHYMGFTGIFEIARRMARIVRNPMFNRNLAAHTRLPYFDSWYKEDPFSHIVKGNAA